MVIILSVGVASVIDWRKALKTLLWAGAGVTQAGKAIKSMGGRERAD